MEEEYLAGEDKGDLLRQLDANALHDPVWNRVGAAVLAPARQVLLCWRTILHIDKAIVMMSLHKYNVCVAQKEKGRESSGLACGCGKLACI